jgi:hypothetical protein
MTDFWNGQMATRMASVYAGRTLHFCHGHLANPISILNFFQESEGKKNIKNRAREWTAMGGPRDK